MIKRVIEIESRAYCSVHHRQLCVKGDKKERSVPLEDVGVLILNSPQSSYSHAVLSECASRNVALVLCNDKHLPCGLFVPFDGNSTQSRIMALQLLVTEPTKKRLWQSIVRAKLRAQAALLKKCGIDDNRLYFMAGKVRSGDPDNYEAQGAQLYWKRLFGTSFRRRQQGEGINALLNYGYAVVRAALARALVATGLHPSLGIHHHNQYNAFCLVDDLIEPLRPAVDNTVFGISKNHDNKPSLNSDTKIALLETLSETTKVDNRSYPLMVAMQMYTSSLHKVFAKEQRSLAIPIV